uniref:Uncharacterized protein n=1 Tax=Ciona savignyi TaxID=51511 RepID=H2ZM33_CIOSA
MLLNRAASCHQHSKRLYHYWTKFFGTRLSTATVALRVLNRTWDVMNGNTLVWPPSTRFPPNDLVAAELVIVRRKAAETGERLGKYKTLVLHFRRRFTEPGNYRMQATARLREAARANTTFSTPAQGQ